uniref:Cadherin domain-containing protein n=1 Tax=Pygocentrus nattereri TaxID=42514 RepID=A0AAR2L2A1_PYGNA
GVICLPVCFLVKILFVNFNMGECVLSRSALPALECPKSSRGLKRQKREWVLLYFFYFLFTKYPICVQIQSSRAKQFKMVYSISGEGADQDPKGLFTINRNNGSLYVTRPLDREAKDKYVLQAHAEAADGDDREKPMDIIVIVLDKNDNTPIFTQNPFLGTVPEASAIGFEFMTVTATDADKPNTEYADITYSILSQNPQEPNAAMFTINPVTGVIRVNAAGLDREVRADMRLINVELMWNVVINESSFRTSV